MADIQHIVKEGEISVASIASELGFQSCFVDICSTLLSPIPDFFHASYILSCDLLFLVNEKY